MTRLSSKDIYNISATLNDYNNELMRKTGCTLSQIASYASEFDNREKCYKFHSFKVGVIPITSGKGVIEGFSKTIADIISFLGFKTFITQNLDVSGLAEAFAKDANIVMLADDNRFVAINLYSRKVVDNAYATAKGYVAALNLMVGGLKKKDVLLIGAGRVGICAAHTLAKLGANVSVYDVNYNTSTKLVTNLKVKYTNTIKLIDDLDDSLTRYRIIFDASPGQGFIKEKHITNETFIAAPGVPLCLSPEVIPAISERLLHDPLQIGVATMIYDAVSSR